MELVQALKGGMREKVQIASKFGIVRKDGIREICGDPEYVRSACEASLKRLDVDYIDLYYVHRIDTRVPIEVTVSMNHSLGISRLVITDTSIYAHFTLCAHVLSWSMICSY